ncbi:hypothetical protein QBC45DRAFT_437849 [Copromyces sp. CBS 386.78]|nr:hypothetical protein QBC45DRAFT_437849 [Copromyces sp. CBS 386.78]
MAERRFDVLGAMAPVSNRDAIPEQRSAGITRTFQSENAWKLASRSSRVLLGKDTAVAVVRKLHRCVGGGTVASPGQGVDGHWLGAPILSLGRYLWLGLSMNAVGNRPSIYECVDRDLRTVCPFLPKTPPNTPSAPAPGTSNTRTNTGTGTDQGLEEYNTTPPLIIIFTAWKSGRHTLVCLSFAIAALEFWALFLGTLQEQEELGQEVFRSRSWRLDAPTQEKH